MCVWKKAKPISWSWISFAFSFSFGFSSAQGGDLVRMDLKSTWADRKLETREVRSIDPMVLNPFFSRWVLKRPVELQILDSSIENATKSGEKSPENRLKSVLVKAQTVLYTRDLPEQDVKRTFPCTRSGEIDFNYATLSGTRFAAEAARDEWHALLLKHSGKLEKRLAGLRQKKPEMLLTSTQAIFHEWLEGLDHEWALHSEKLIRKKEWLYYAKEAACTEVLSTREFMFQERHRKALPFPTVALKSGRPPARRLNSDSLARLPAKLWEGLFSVRMSVDVGDKLLNGQFLIDSTAQESLMAPQFLKWQGINPVFITQFGKRRHSIEWISGAGESIPLYVFGVKLGTLSLPLHDFYLADTELYGPPDYRKTCCDGVLGLDFLRRYRVEFLEEPSKAVRVWDPGASIDDGTWHWVPVYFDSEEKKPTSDCVFHATHAKDQEAKRVPRTGLQGVRWSTATIPSVGVHQPWQSTVSKLSQSHRVQWELECPIEPIGVEKSKSIASHLIPTIPEGGGKRYASAYPSSSVGIEILGRGTVMWDLPNGRIGFNKEAIKTPVWQNRSGLELEFDFNSVGDRILRVVEIRPDTSASLLKKGGLRVGTEIVSLDGILVEDLDQDHVDRLLMGRGWSPQVDKKTLNVEWRGKSSKQGAKKISAPLRVRF